MADENGKMPKIHIDFVANGDFVHLRTDSGAEMAEVIQGFEQSAEPIFKGIGNIKQASLVTGVFSGNASQQGGPVGTPQSAPKAAGTTAPGAIPSCPTHGQMKDMRGKRTAAGAAMRFRYYCSKFGCKDVQPSGEWIE